MERKRTQFSSIVSLQASSQAESKTFPRARLSSRSMSAVFQQSPFLSSGNAITAAAVSGSGANLMVTSLAATTGLSFAALLPPFIAQLTLAPGTLVAGLPSKTPYAARGNLLGLIGAVQTFALLRKLPVRQSVAFSKVAANLAWTVRLHGSNFGVF